MSILHRILCRMGFHQRSRRSARRTESGWKSQCRWCGQAMIKVKGGDWRVMVKAPKPSREQRTQVRQEEARHRRTPPPRRRKGTKPDA